MQGFCRPSMLCCLYPFLQQPPKVKHPLAPSLQGLLSCGRKAGASGRPLGSAMRKTQTSPPARSHLQRCCSKPWRVILLGEGTGCLVGEERDPLGTLSCFRGLPWRTKRPGHLPPGDAKGRKGRRPLESTDAQKPLPALWLPALGTG